MIPVISPLMTEQKERKQFLSVEWCNFTRKCMSRHPTAVRGAATPMKPHSPTAGAHLHDNRSPSKRILKGKESHKMSEVFCKYVKRQRTMPLSRCWFTYVTWLSKYHCCKVWLISQESDSIILQESDSIISQESDSIISQESDSIISQESDSSREGLCLCLCEWMSKTDSVQLTWVRAHCSRLHLGIVSSLC